MGEVESGRVRSTWGNIIRVGKELENLGIRWSRGFQKKVGNGVSTLFWKECWVGEITFENRFPRLYRLERNKDVRVCLRGRVESDGVSWSWDWVRVPRGRVLGELEVLNRILENISLCADKEDEWRWTYDRNGDFSVSSLRKQIEEKILVEQSNANFLPTVWNKLLPRKVCIFVWRAIKDRMPVRVSLDNRGIDLGSILCPRCGMEPESLHHCLIRCPHSMAIWKDVFAWWGWNDFTACSVAGLLTHKGRSMFSSGVSKVWQAVLWASSYQIWYSRNERVFRNKPSCAAMVIMMIKMHAFNWISHR